MNIFSKFSLFFLLFLSGFSSIAYAQEGYISFGFYGNIVGATGEPSNDVLGFGLIGSYHLKDEWFIDVELIQSEADLERPWKVLGIVQDETAVKTIDAIYDATLIMAHVGQNLRSDSDSYVFYWSAGVGIQTVDVEDVTGPVLGGGTFNITTDVSTETIIGGKLGIKQHLSDKWSMNYALRMDYHIADWTVTDTVSTTTTKIDNYLTKGVLIGVEMKF